MKIKTKHLLKIVRLFGLPFFLLLLSCGGGETSTTAPKTLRNSMAESISKIKKSFREVDSTFGLEGTEGDEIDPILKNFFDKEDGTYIKDSDNFSDDFSLEDLEDEEESPKNRDELMKILRRRRDAAALVIRDVEEKVNRLLDQGKAKEAQDLIDETTRTAKKYTTLANNINHVIYDKKEQDPNNPSVVVNPTGKGEGEKNGSSVVSPPPPYMSPLDRLLQKFDPNDELKNAQKRVGVDF